MTKDDLPFMPPFFDRYINLTEGDFLESLKKYSPAVVFKDTDQLLLLGDRVYEPGKWTVKDILQHCIDTERVMAYRAMAIARGENQALPGYDENLYAENTGASLRSVHDLMEEFIAVRRTTQILFKYMDNSALLREGNANGTVITPLALAFVIAGHAIHHQRILKERYYPILGH